MSKISQIILSLLTFIVAIYIPLVTAYAQDASSSSKSSIDSSYQLPYPGMLPGNPLYFLKTIRDDLTAFFISKPLDKAKFDLLQSDKNVEASYLLVSQQQGKAQVALQTFSQAQDYFQQAITETVNAKKQGYNTKEIISELIESNQKHVQMLHAVALQTGNTNDQTVRQYLDREEFFAKTLKTLR